MKKYITIILFFLALTFLPVSSHAQGFMGHRFALGYTLGSYLDLEGNSTLLTKVHQAEIDFIFNRRATLGLSYTNSGRMYYFFNDTDVTRSERRVRLTSQGLGLRFKWFRAQDGSIAPLGAYYTAKLTPIFANQSTADNRQPELLRKSFHPVIFVGVGRNSVIWNRLLLQFGGEFGLILGSNYYSSEDIETGFSVNKANSTIQSRYTFQFKIGLMLIP